jgi:hypothetical protein
MSFSVSVYRQTNDGSSPATAESSYGTRVAGWHETWFYWMYELVESGKAIDLGGNGYPSLYTARAEDLIAQIPSCSDDETPEHRVIVRLKGRVVGSSPPQHEFDPAVVKACRPDEWLLLVAWDNS